MDPTRVTENNQTLIDHICTTGSDKVRSTRVPVISINDHHIVILTTDSGENQTLSLNKVTMRGSC